MKSGFLGAEAGRAYTSSYPDCSIENAIDSNHDSTDMNNCYVSETSSGNWAIFDIVPAVVSWVKILNREDSLAAGKLVPKIIITLSYKCPENWSYNFINCILLWKLLYVHKAARQVVPDHANSCTSRPYRNFDVWVFVMGSGEKGK